MLFVEEKRGKWRDGKRREDQEQATDSWHAFIPSCPPLSLNNDVTALPGSTSAQKGNSKQYDGDSLTITNKEITFSLDHKGLERE